MNKTCDLIKYAAQQMNYFLLKTENNKLII